MKLTELIEKRIDENVASYDLGTLESYKYLIELIAIEYHNKQLRSYNDVRQSEHLPCDCGVMLKETKIQVFCPKCYITWKMK